MSLPIGYKLSPLGPIPQDWEVKSLDKFCTISGEYGINAPAVNYSINLPHYLRITDIQNGKLSLKKRKSVITDEIEKYTLAEGDIVFARTGGTVGITYLHSGNRKLIFAGFLIRYRTNPTKLLPYYLKLYTETGRYRNWVKVMSVRSGQPGINGKEYGGMKIPLPPLPEQKAIASILSSCDETITGTQKLIEKLELRHKTLCQQLLTGKKRVEGFDGKWKEEKIEKYITYTPREIVKPKEDYLALGVRSHAKGIFQKPDTSTNENAMDVLFEVKKDDLVMSITFAWEHAVAIAREKDDGGLVSHRFPTYIFKEGKATSKFFKYFIKQPRFKYQLGVISPGGAGRNRVMSKKDFIKLRITIPNLEEQIAISKILDESEKEINHTKQKISNLKKIKKGLMQQLLTGKTRVPKAYLTN